jgi:three-Cys-motif partner protein
MKSPYVGREQTATKHFILKSYLQTLTYKLFSSGHPALTYVDGFSGPWKTRTESFSDTSFMIAIDVLKNAHFEFLKKNSAQVTKCFFVENDPKAFSKLARAVQKFHFPEQGFHVATFPGRFEDAVQQIIDFVGKSFALIFIDPTGWTGYPYGAIAPVLKHRPSEVLINFMYDHINRAAAMNDPKTVASLDPILGGPGWKDRLIRDVPLGQEIERTFRQELKKAGSYDFVLSTCIEKTTADRPHFFIAYGTRNAAGLKAFREIEYKALRDHQRLRVQAKFVRKEEQTGQTDMFVSETIASDTSVEVLVANHRSNAKSWINNELRRRRAPILFSSLTMLVLEQFMLRETDVKDICVELANENVIAASWKSEQPSKRKPNDSTKIELLIQQAN